ncbi:DUF292-domain-containing protein [Aspergillus indologenus CBS 114.80]|uniref:DUF292-domain-containing protein n=1 Tax=Aspergillus indologenus CBS 114.80 TaxID=1450541 RepID=A0A2V5HZB1_9EURO|nr:DUF292-domain-containing protein [Aspergillus indologenus CBS 114.80]
MQTQTKLTSTLHLLIPRLRLLQKKATASSVLQRRDLAALLADGRDSSARIRVENVIATDIAVEAMEMVELYCELLLARANVLDQAAFGERGALARNRARVAAAEYLDAALDEAAAVIFYATPRFPHDVRELTVLRTLLAERWGKEFMALAQEDAVPGVRVPGRVAKALRVRAPAAALVDCYLREIARAYGVNWGGAPTGAGWDDGSGSAGEERGDGSGGDGSGGDGSGGDGSGGDGGQGAHGGDGDLPATPRRSPTENETEARRASETLALNQATPPRGWQTQKSPVSVAPPGPRLDNLHPRVKVPGESGSAGSATAETGNTKSEIPELDELTRRFAALRR